MKMKKAVLLIPAAGQGSRMGGQRNKPYLFLKGKPVLASTLLAFSRINLFQSICIIVAPGEEDLLRKLVLVPFFPDWEHLAVIIGGRERQYSVFNGLKYFQENSLPNDALVCIHDGARPLVSSSVILSVYHAALKSGAAVCAVPVKDTIKEVDESQMVVKTVPRQRLVAVQTPQCFRFSLLWEAHLKARDEGFTGSDDAVLLERLGFPVKVVPGADENIKLTTPSDLLLARALSAHSCSSLENMEQGTRDELDSEYGWNWSGCR